MYVRFLSSLLVLTASTLFASPSFAECIDDDDFGFEWVFTQQGPQTIAADGPLVIAASFRGDSEFIDDRQETVTVSDVQENVIPGTLEVILRDSKPRLVWTPSDPLSLGDRLTVVVESEFSSSSADLIVVETIEPPVVTINDLNRREFEVVAERRCCDADFSDGCDDPCSSRCEQCGTEAFVYPTRAGFRANVTYDVINDLYGVYYRVVRDDLTEFPDTSEALEFATMGSFSNFATTLPDDEESFCVEYEVRNVVTGEVLSSDSACAAETPLATASRNDPEPLDTSVCSGDFVRVISADGTTEQVPLDGSGGGTGTGGGKAETGGCATGGGATGSGLLVIAILGFAWRRRSRLSA